MTLSITSLSIRHRYAECHVFVVMLSVIMLSVIMQDLIMLRVVNLNVVILSAVALCSCHRVNMSMADITLFTDDCNAAAEL